MPWPRLDHNTECTLVKFNSCALEAAVGQRPCNKRPQTSPEEARGHHLRTYRKDPSARKKRFPRLGLPSGASLILFRPRVCRLRTTKRLRCPDVFETDPEDITQLWKSFMSYTTDTNSSKGKRRPGSVTSASASTLGQRWRQPPPSRV
jgi:hypothetical protein